MCTYKYKYIYFAPKELIFPKFIKIIQFYLLPPQKKSINKFQNFKNYITAVSLTKIKNNAKVFLLTTPIQHCTGSAT